MHHNIFVSFRRWIAAAWMCFMLYGGAAVAVPNDDRAAALSKGDYGQDFRTIRPLAAEGNADAHFIFPGPHVPGRGATLEALRVVTGNSLISAEEVARTVPRHPLMMAEARNATTQTQSRVSVSTNSFDQFDTEPATPKQEPVASSLEETAIRVVPMKSPLPAAGRITDRGYIEISGEIRQSAVPRLLAYIDQAKKSTSPFTHFGVMVSLNSRGGEVKAAMEMGMILRSQAAHIFIDSNAECSSACILVLAGGVWRNAFEGSKLGIHRPSFPAQEFAELSHAQSQGQYSALSATVKQYLSLMGISDSLYDAMMIVPSRTVKYLSDEVAEATNLIGSDPAHEEWMRTRQLRASGPERRKKLDQYVDCINVRPPERECSHYLSGW